MSFPAYNHCQADSCSNGALCDNTGSGYRCVCKSGYTGDTCDIVQEDGEDDDDVKSWLLPLLIVLGVLLLLLLAICFCLLCGHCQRKNEEKPMTRQQLQSTAPPVNSSHLHNVGPLIPLPQSTTPHNPRYQTSIQPITKREITLPNSPNTIASVVIPHDQPPAYKPSTNYKLTDNLISGKGYPTSSLSGWSQRTDRVLDSEVYPHISPDDYLSGRSKIN